ncbi:MAG: carbohydrate ABC transporter permease [Pseudomonadota bacterium]
MGHGFRTILAQTGVYAGVATLLLVVVFPFYWMVTTSLKPFREISIERTLLPREPSLRNYVDLFAQTQMTQHLFNTLWVSLAATVLSLLLASMTAYCISRQRSGVGEILARLSLFAYLVPSIVLILPIYVLLQYLGLINTLSGLVLSYLSFTLPLAIWMMRIFFEAVPKTMEEAAAIDCANRWQTFVLVILPQVVPGLVSTGVFVFILCWSEFLYPLVLISTSELNTVTVTLDSLTGGGQNIKFGLLMAASTVVTVPVLLMFLFMQKSIARGFAAGGHE